MNPPLIKFSILDLLPQNKEMKIKNIHDADSILFKIEQILTLYDDFKDKVIQKKFGAFDPLIGENSCQIRAYMLYNLFLERSLSNLVDFTTKLSTVITCLLNRIHLLKVRLKETKADISGNKFTDKSNIDLRKFLFINELVIDFPEDVYISFLIYFLSRYTVNDNSGIHIGIDYKKMGNELHCSKNWSRRLVHKYQVLISKISCQYVRKLAEDIKIKHPEYLVVLDMLVQRDDDGRYVIPCYLSMDILLKHMTLNSTLILIQHIIPDTNQSKELFFDVYENEYKLVNRSKIPANKPCVVFRGISNRPLTEKNTLKNRLLQLNIKQLLLGSTARHPQFPGKKLTHLKFNPFSLIQFGELNSTPIKSLKLIEEKFLYMKDWAYSHGCCLEQPETFFASHIFCENYSYYSDLRYTEMTDNFFRSINEQGIVQQS